MSAEKFDFHPMTLGAILKSSRLMVPPNQRSYRWEQSHVLSLLQDFDQAVHRDEYFLGTVVLVQTSHERLSIQDGQQRLATTTILLARIRDRLSLAKRGGSAGSVDTDFIRSFDRNAEAIVPKLLLNAMDNDFFVRRTLAAPTDHGYADRPTAMRQSHHRLEAASQEIEAFLEKKLSVLQPENAAALLNQWVDFIEKSAWVVEVKVSDAVNAYRIFETLNDRGVKASQADILKNYLFSRAGERLSEAEALWNQITAVIESSGSEDSDDSLVTYLRHYWITVNGPTKGKDLAASIREGLTSPAQALQFLSDCAKATQAYIALSNSQHQRWLAYKRSVRQHVETIHLHLQVEQIKPLLFAVALHFTAGEAEKAFKLFVSWTVRFLIVGGRGGMLDSQYSMRAHEVGIGKITKARDLREAIKPYVPSDTEFQEAFAVARVSRPYVARYYLRAIENTRVADPEPEYVPNDNAEDINLEHVMPLTPSKGWPIDPETALAAQKLLGNMVLLRATDNKDLGNKSYGVKKPVFAASSYSTTQDAAEAEDWDLAAIRARQSRLAATAVSTWSLKFGGE